MLPNEVKNIETEYLNSSIDIETLIINSQNSEKILYIYEDEECIFRVFYDVGDIVNFFIGKTSSFDEFENRDELNHSLLNIWKQHSMC